MVRGFLSRVVTLLILAVVLSGLIQATNLFSRDLLFTQTQTELSFWARGNYRPEPTTILRTEQALHTLLSAAPADPQYLAAQANYVVWQGHWTEDFRAAQQFGQRAVEAQYAALESRPAHRQSWAIMVKYAARIQDEAMRTESRSRVKALEAETNPI